MILDEVGSDRVARCRWSWSR